MSVECPACAELRTLIDSLATSVQELSDRLDILEAEVPDGFPERVDGLAEEIGNVERELEKKIGYLEDDLDRVRRDVGALERGR